MSVGDFPESLTLATLVGVMIEGRLSVSHYVMPPWAERRRRRSRRPAPGARAYVHTCIHTHVHTYTRTYVYTYMRIYVHTYIHTYIRTYTHTVTYTHIHTHTMLRGAQEAAPLVRPGSSPRLLHYHIIYRLRIKLLHNYSIKLYVWTVSRPP